MLRHKAPFLFCRCERCRDPTELNSFVSATRCLRCNGEGIILPDNPVSSETVIWRCDRFVT